MILHKIALKTSKQDGKVQGPHYSGLDLQTGKVPSQVERYRDSVGQCKKDDFYSSSGNITYTRLQMKEGGGGAAHQSGNSFRIIPIDELSLLFIIIPAYAARCPEKDVGM